MSKPILEILSQMYQEDTKSGGKTIAVYNSLDSTLTTRRSGDCSRITMLAPGTAIESIMRQETIPLLILVNKEAYFKLKE